MTNTVETVEIPLTRGLIAVIDAEDLPLVAGYTWYAKMDKYTWYAETALPTVEGKSRTIKLHRLIMHAQPGQQVDHKDGDGLNNRRTNLRLCNNQQNGCNRRKLSRNTSGYKGVHWNKQSNKWEAQITVNGKHRYLGYFTDIELAAKARKLAEQELHGEYAHVDSPEMTHIPTTSTKSRKPRNNTSGYKGVYWNRQANKWRANIKVSGIPRHLGYFTCKHCAGRAYNAAALEAWGNAAVLNTITEDCHHE